MVYRLVRLNLPPKSVDNATYYNRQKTKHQQQQIKWLNRQNSIMTQISKTLLEKVKQHRPKPIYLTNEAARLYGHTVLRLPASLCELNESLFKSYIYHGHHSKMQRLSPACNTNPNLLEMVLPLPPGSNPPHHISTPEVK